MFNSFLPPLLIATAFAIVMMAVTWYVAVRINNFSIVDIAWSIGSLPIAVFYALTFSGNPLRRELVAAMAGLWSFRLALHVAVRVVKHHPQEDVRYSKLREGWGKNLKSRTFLFFEFQALILAALSFAFLIPCLNGAQSVSVLEWSGATLWLMAVIGESVADHQLKQFRANKNNRGKVCEVGLWNYSRHPNYFFEWLVWVGFFVFACGSPYGVYTVLCPALMLFFLLRVTGIPLTEELSLKSKGEIYRKYQETTSAFIPWFKKSRAGSN